MKNILCSVLGLLTAFSMPVLGQVPSPANASTTEMVPSSIDPAKAAEIKKMLDLTGVLKLMGQMKTRLLETYKDQHPGVPPEVWKRIDQEMDMGQLLQDIIPLYDKYYTLDDLKAANAFYGSPAGQHLLAATPQLMRESMQIGQAWGQKVNQRVAADLAAEAQSAPTPSAATNVPASK
jgi:hypothetical protein